MTIEEKREALERKCISFAHCRECPLWPMSGAGSCYSNVSAAKVERHYDIMFGGGDKQPENGAPAADKLTRHEQICDEIKALYKRKNADYGDSFHKTFVEEGMAMPRIRLTDKLERFKKLTKSGDQNVKDESVRDTLIDLANYAIMTILELEG